MYNEYFAKTALYREQTKKGTKWLSFLTFGYPLLRLIPSLMILLMSGGFAGSEFVSQLQLFAMFFIGACELLLYFFLVRLNKVALIYTLTCFLVRAVFTVATWENFLAPIFDLALCLLTVFYLIKRKDLFGFSTKDRPAIQLSPQEVLLNSSFRCGIGSHFDGKIRFDETALTVEGSFLHGKPHRYEYETLVVSHDRLMLRWMFGEKGSGSTLTVTLFPFQAGGLKKLLNQRGVAFEKQ